MISDWHTKDGNIILHPLAGYSLALMPMLVALRLNVLSGPGSPDAGDKFLQVGIGAAQARELGQALIAAADKADKRPPGRTQ